MRRHELLATLALVTTTTVPAYALAPEVKATTLLQLRQDPRDGSVYTTVPAYTLFNLQARKVRLVKKMEADVVVSSWGRINGGDPVDRGYLNGDISLAYLESRAGPFGVRAGRQLVFDGVARGAHLDGIAASARPWEGLGVSVFAGAPVVPLLQDHRGLAMAGGRVSWRKSYDTQLGISALHVLEQGRHAHQHVGLDGRTALMRMLVLSWMVRWSTLPGSSTLLALWPRTKDGGDLEAMLARAVAPAEALQRALPSLAEADLALSFQPLEALQVTAEYRRTSLSLFIPRSSIFSVFSAEQRDQLGATVATRIRQWLTFDVDAAALSTASGFGAQGGARLATRLGPRRSTTLGTQARVLKVPSSGFLMARAFGSQKLPLGLSTTVDGDVYLLEKPVHGQRFTAMVSWTNGIMFRPGWDVALQVAAGSSPLATARVEALARVSYNAGIPLP
ncbi:MAG: hypothetical protein AB2A00_07135 [Myxococcota bacterium]